MRQLQVQNQLLLNLEPVLGFLGAQHEFSWVAEVLLEGTIRNLKKDRTRDDRDSVIDKIWCRGCERIYLTTSEQRTCQLLA